MHVVTRVLVAQPFAPTSKPGASNSRPPAAIKQLQELPVASKKWLEVGFLAPYMKVARAQRRRGEHPPRICKDIERKCSYRNNSSNPVGSAFQTTFPQGRQHVSCGSRRFVARTTSFC